MNQPEVTGGFAEMMSRLAKSIAGPAPIHHLEAQHYFAVDFSLATQPDATESHEVPQAARR
jgi:hypothetical protein